MVGVLHHKESTAGGSCTTTIMASEDVANALQELLGSAFSRCDERLATLKAKQVRLTLMVEMLGRHAPDAPDDEEDAPDDEEEDEGDDEEEEDEEEGEEDEED